MQPEQTVDGDADPIKFTAFIQHQQKESWEALKRQMGPVPLTPWYEFTPGSCLPPKKVYRLHGTRGYDIEQVVCLEKEEDLERYRQSEEGIKSLSDVRRENVNVQRKGKEGIGEASDLEREKMSWRKGRLLKNV